MLYELWKDQSYPYHLQATNASLTLKKPPQTKSALAACLDFTFFLCFVPKVQSITLSKKKHWNTSGNGFRWCSFRRLCIITVKASQRDNLHKSSWKGPTPTHSSEKQIPSNTNQKTFFKQYRCLSLITLERLETGTFSPQYKIQDGSPTTPQISEFFLGRQTKCYPERSTSLQSGRQK